ncbi:Lsr2 family protein [Quadrisphaera sp. INWT6]|uniref:histone-like nucleoid-structuring protein Lsr2 n=1 Tax=Quadrisphaera sp. INWT6 TaxID=2596917 RepID=UPI0018923480|nr:Lsr2 family protein [Quadrisphaera sp. INWT6]MBF5081823.1 Lsr2 family protein [Quadrisphaera sp. INWT6]
MAQKLQVVLVDDVDGGAADQTVQFSLDGVDYEIDLSDARAAQLRGDLAPWVGRARRRQPAPRGSAGGVDQAAVRAWARRNGHTVNERGRVPAAVVGAYRAATGS